MVSLTTDSDHAEANPSKRQKLDGHLELESDQTLKDGSMLSNICVHVCVCMCVRACMCAYVHMCVQQSGWLRLLLLIGYVVSPSMSIGQLTKAKPLAPVSLTKVRMYVRTYVCVCV